MKQKDLHIAVIGLGKMGRIRIDLIKNNQYISKISCYEPDHNIKEYNDLDSADSAESLIEDESTDAVFICTPNYAMRDLITMAVKNGKHVFCEKPPGISYEEAIYFNSLQKERPDLKIKFGFNHRYLAHYNELKQIISSSQYGKILWVKGVYGKGYDDNYYSSWRSKKNMAGGGILIDQGIHMLDLITDLMGDLDVVSAAIDCLKWKQADVEDNVFLHLRSKDDVPISVHSSMVHCKHTFKIEVGTDSAVIIIEGIKSSTRSYGDEIIHVNHNWQDNFVESYSKKENNKDFYTLKEECEEFIMAIVDGLPLKNGTTEDAVRIMKLINDIYSYAGVQNSGKSAF